MSLKRKSCRATERVTMKKLFAKGETVAFISDRLRVEPNIIIQVVEGEWDSTEKAMTLVAMEKNKKDLIGKADEESSRIAQIAAAAAAAITGQSQVVDPAALRKEIEAQVRAEIAAEKPAETEPSPEPTPEPTPEILSPQQRGANKRKENTAARVADAIREAEAA